jgi:uracil-DNA glycosylase
MEVKMESSWKEHLQSEFEKSYFEELTTFVKKEYKDEVVYPPPKYVFRAFELCPFDTVEVVILGQDPYHGARQANGLSFAVEQGIALPPSLQNMYKEIAKEYDVSYESLVQKGGDLSRWAFQGVLLLNATLTVRAHMAGSHQGRGWEVFTDAAIAALSREREQLVFMLWGNYAKQKGAHIDRAKHLVLEAAHPSPFSAHSGFFGCNHFKKANDYLLSNNKKPIEWV